MKRRTYRKKAAIYTCKFSCKTVGLTHVQDNWPNHCLLQRVSRGLQLQEIKSVLVFETCDKKNVLCLFFPQVIYGRLSVAGVATALQARQSGVRIPIETKVFLLSETSRRALGLTQHPIQLAPGFFPGDKAVGE
jgi:hypothetical protein